MACIFTCRNGHEVPPCVSCGSIATHECLACRDAEIAKLRAENVGLRDGLAIRDRLIKERDAELKRRDDAGDIVREAADAVVAFDADVCGTLPERVRQVTARALAAESALAKARKDGIKECIDLVKAERDAWQSKAQHAEFARALTTDLFARMTILFHTNPWRAGGT